VGEAGAVTSPIVSKCYIADMAVEHRPPPGKYKLTIDDFLRLDETGVFGTDRTELLDGDVIIMSAEYRPHAWVVGELGYLIRRKLEEIGSDLYAMGASVAVSIHDMPLPDIVLTREPHGSGPIPLSSVALIIEVSASTLERDIKYKLSMYARFGVPEYWVADVGGRQIHRMWSPAETNYQKRDATPFGEPITSVTIAGLTVSTREL
jgi:Uma2 family endonuclease